MDEHQAIWDKRYEKVLREEQIFEEERWLESWLHLVPQREYPKAFDIGCGAGHNTRLLLDHGFEVTAIDFSKQALALCRQKAPEARIKLRDIRKGIPFPEDRFDLILADLSLHYFSLPQTNEILRTLANRLTPRGLFAGRFNSTKDTNYGADSGQAVPGDANLCIVDGVQKRFYTRECMNDLFGPTWKIVTLVEKSTTRFGTKKIFWEVVSVKNHTASNHHGA